ncbi:MAG: hypothetical protein U0269_33695 [Polyangiales bacterium]
MRTNVLLCLVTAAMMGCGNAPAPVMDSGADASASDSAAVTDAASDAGEAGNAPDDCLIQQVAMASQCAESCGARLTLPSGRRFCTQPCSDDAYCQRYSSTLKCATEVGACVERCASDAECTARGFPRCHPVAMFCDTIPPCSTNAQCTSVGLTRCVLPGAYCE